MTQVENTLLDGYKRKINYLRVSITDLCNLRCFYCMPSEGVKKMHHDDILRLEEFLEVIRVAVDLGVNKVRLTGGEPLIKRGLVPMVRDIAAMDGVDTVALTTNGTRLAKYAERLKEVGLSRINVSLDSFDSDTYRRITRVGNLSDVLEGIDKALEVGFKLKINAVLMDDFNLAELDRFINFALEKNVEVRFIERMSFEDNDPYISQESIIEYLSKSHKLEQLATDNSSTHVALYKVDSATIGFISPRSTPFCAGCNKLRLTPDGHLRACLASEVHVDMRDVLRSPHTDLDIQRAIIEATRLKPATGPWNASAAMWRVGG